MNNENTGIDRTAEF